MLRETGKIIRRDIDFLPLKSYHNIREGNALRMDWDVIEIPSDIPTIHANNVHLIIEPEPMMANEPVVEYDELNIVTRHFDGNPKQNSQRYQVSYDYIIGNPPFVGKKEQTKEQKEDLKNLFDKKAKGIGNIDYVAGWYKKALDTIYRTNTKVAFVSTNSITQGEQVPILWRELYKQDINIVFARRTFSWDSEASEKAHVHCVIIGFVNGDFKGEKYIYDGEAVKVVSEISPYLVEGSPCS